MWRIRALSTMLVVLGLCCTSMAETLKFRGAFNDQANKIEFTLNLTLTRTDPKATFTVAGSVTAADGDYTVSGSFYPTTKKLKGLVKRKGLNAPFEQPIDGTLQPDGNTLNVTTVLLSPHTRTDMKVAFAAKKTSDSAEANATIRAFSRDRVAGNLENPELTVDDKAGRVTLRTRDSKGKPVEWNVYFTPLPQAFAFGGKWDFAVDATAVPATEYCNLQIQLCYLDNDHKNASGQPDPYIVFDLRNGERKFKKTVTWNCPGPPGYQGVSFSFGSSGGPIVLYKVIEIKRSEFDRLTAAYNQSGTGQLQPSGVVRGGTLPEKPGTAALRSVTVKGSVTVRRRTDTDWTPIKPDSVLDAGTVVSVGPESEATMQLPNGATIVIRAGSELRVEDLSPTGGQAGAQVRLLVGSLHYRGGPATGPGTRVMVAECTASTRGTEFTLTFDPKTNLVVLRLTDGKVDFEPGRGLEKILLEAPTTLTWTASGG